MSNRRVLLTLDDETIDLLNELTTERRKGEFVATLIRQAAQGQAPPTAGILERMEQRLARMERMLEKLVDTGSQP